MCSPQAARYAARCWSTVADHANSAARIGPARRSRARGRVVDEQRLHRLRQTPRVPRWHQCAPRPRRPPASPSPSSSRAGRRTRGPRAPGARSPPRARGRRRARRVGRTPGAGRRRSSRSATMRVVQPLVAAASRIASRAPAVPSRHHEPELRVRGRDPGEGGDERRHVLAWLEGRCEREIGRTDPDRGESLEIVVALGREARLVDAVLATNTGAVGPITAARRSPWCWLTATIDGGPSGRGPDHPPEEGDLGALVPLGMLEEGQVVDRDHRWGRRGAPAACSAGRATASTATTSRARPAGPSAAPRAGARAVRSGRRRAPGRGVREGTSARDPRCGRAGGGRPRRAGRGPGRARACRRRHRPGAWAPRRRRAGAARRRSLRVAGPALPGLSGASIAAR